MYSAQSSELVYSLFAECSATPTDPFGLCKKSSGGIASTIILLLLASLLGFLLSSVTFGLDIPAGIILPSMAIGALYGRALGLLVSTWQLAHPNLILFARCEPDIPCVTPGTYAIIGAASALGGVTRMTVSIVVIMFELTGALTYVLPIMIAVMISKWVGDAVNGKRGIYESWIHLRAYPLLDNRDEAPIPDLPAAHVYTPVDHLVVLTATGHTIASLLALQQDHPFRGYPVVADPPASPLLLGYISRTELAFALRASTAPPRSLPPDTEAFFAHPPHADFATTLDLRPWMDQTPLTLSAKSSLGLTASLFQKLGLRYVLFTEKGELKGVATKKDIWGVLSGKRGEEREEEITRGVRDELLASGEERGLLGGDSPATPQVGFHP